MAQIMTEYTTTRRMLEEIYDGPLEEQRPRVSRSLRLRREGLAILHQDQIRLFKTWRRHRRAGEDEAAERLLPTLLVTVNAIASGLGTTG